MNALNALEYAYCRNLSVSNCQVVVFWERYSFGWLLTNDHEQHNSGSKSKTVMLLGSQFGWHHVVYTYTLTKLTPFL